MGWTFLISLSLGSPTTLVSQFSIVGTRLRRIDPGRDRARRLETWPPRCRADCETNEAAPTAPPARQFRADQAPARSFYPDFITPFSSDPNYTGADESELS